MSEEILEHEGWTAEFADGMTIVYDDDQNRVSTFNHRFTKSELATYFRAYHEGHGRGSRHGYLQKEREILNALGIPIHAQP